MMQLCTSKAYQQIVTQGHYVTHLTLKGTPMRNCHAKARYAVCAAGQSSNLTTNHLIQCLSQHVNATMDVKVTRPDEGNLYLKVKVSEALQ